MDWRGIDWVVPAFEIVILVLPVYAFIVLYRRVKGGAINKQGALWRYAFWVIVPVIVYVVLFFALVGIEEMIKASIITEGLARSFFILVGLGVIIWLVSTLVFAVTILLLRQQKQN